jgi:acyl-CoA synthetase (AMP-forming)/AMP-acid ligase II
VHDLLDYAVSNHADGVAILEDGRNWSYGQLAGESAAIATWLTAQGVKPGDRVLTNLPNSAYLVALLYACSMTGAIFAPVSPHTTAFYLKAFIADLEPSVIVMAETARSWDMSLPGIVVRDLSALIVELPDRGAYPRADWFGTERFGSEIAMLMYTSGSTSMPHAVVCPHEQVLFAVHAIGESLGYRRDDVVYCRIPMSFDYGIYQALLCASAACALVLDGATPALRMIATMHQTRTTVVPLVPPLAAVLGPLAVRASARPPIRLFTNTGAALPASAIDRLRSAFPSSQLCLMYGLTECKRATIMPPDADLARPGSVGKPLPGTLIRIMTAGRPTCEPGVTGQVVIEGPHVMAGYWRDAELTRQKFLPLANGARMLLTGDLGRLDADGYLYLAGRLDDTFKRRGMRMSCQEIEHAAIDIPGVKEAAVLVPDEGEDLVIFAATELEPSHVLRSLADRLPPEKCPTRCQVLGVFPVTPRGKVDRGALRRIREGR